MDKIFPSSLVGNQWNSLHKYLSPLNFSTFCSVTWNWNWIESTQKKKPTNFVIHSIHLVMWLLVAYKSWLIIPIKTISVPGRNNTKCRSMQWGWKLLYKTLSEVSFVNGTTLYAPLLLTHSSNLLDLHRWAQMQAADVVDMEIVLWNEPEAGPEELPCNQTVF